MSSYKHLKLTDITSNRYIPKLISDYLNNKENLNNLYSHTLQIESFKDIIKNINFNFDKRSVLVKVLKEQSKDSNTSKQTFDNIDSLAQGNTYCVTTGHQPSIFLGPAYFLYKIIHTIKLCAELANKFTDTNFVPIFWMATEDHDFEEISSINLFKKKISWDPGEIKEAAVGRLKLTNIDTCKESIANTLYRELANNPITKEVLDCYTNDKTLAQATREALNILFGKHGLVILDGDNKDLKRLFAPVIKDDIFNNKAFNIVKNISSEINNCGYKAQIYPQHINVFYLNKEYRKYIIEHKNGYSVTDLNIHLSKSEITNLIDTQPELFSPNVVLRPLYQETILPNLAYIGGGNAIAYWLPLKDMFSAYTTTFPMLIVRNSVSIINDAAYKHLEELNLNILDID
ncbi:MAG: bacillithiol biosynthesis cysteine-adding enzyme BshC [Solitalea-like symbiont of Acarus siro]